MPAKGQPDYTGEAAFDRRTVTVMSAAHFVHDSYPAFVGVLLPVLIPRLGLSLAEAGILASGIRWTSLLQPILGYVADRVDTRYWLVVTPATTAILMSLVGVAPGFMAVFVLLLLTGISHAAFHPAAAAVVSRVSGTRRGRGGSYFMTGGELGRALGPLYIAAVLQILGVEWSWVALLPGVAFSFLLYNRVRRTDAGSFRRPAGDMRDVFAHSRGPVLLLSISMVLRSVANVAAITFLPTLMVARGESLLFAGAAIAAYEIGTTAGTFAGGIASDRFGRRTMLAVSLACGLPLLAWAIAMEPGAPQLAVLALAGFTLLSATSVQLVTMQELFPDNRAGATGITYFMTTAGSTVGVVLAGSLGDLLGLRDALLVAVATGAGALPAVLMLPGRTAPTERA